MFIIEDSREGWVDSVRQLLNSYFRVNQESICFEYSKIRPKNLPIKGFGGLSSGPAPLIDLHESLRTVLDRQAGKLISITTIVDIMNLIGKAVVAGNVRRSAEIAFGDPFSNEYINLKNYDLNPERVDYGWTSNNSVFAKLGMNYDEILDSVVLNGEPGFAWLENMRKYGRLSEPSNNKDDIELLGGNPCLEQTLHNYELCNLVEVFPAKHRDIKEFCKSLQIAFLYAKIVTLGEVHWPQSQQVVKQNRRIGCSLSGIQQFLSMHNDSENKLQKWCDTGYQELKRYDTILSKEYSVNESIKITSIKPSGTVSLLAGATPGLHMPISRYYIRRVRIPKSSVLSDVLRAAGYEVEGDVYDTNAEVVSFPLDSGKNVTTLAQIKYDIMSQVRLAAMLQKHWADNQVSCTVTFSVDEGKEKAKLELASALNRYQYALKGISFLPKLKEGAYPQMPYEEIDESRYNYMAEKLKDIDFESFVKNEENAVLPDNKEFCDTDVCEIR